MRFESKSKWNFIFNPSFQTPNIIAINFAHHQFSLKNKEISKNKDKNKYNQNYKHFEQPQVLQFKIFTHSSKISGWHIKFFFTSLPFPDNEFPIFFWKPSKNPNHLHFYFPLSSGTCSQIGRSKIREIDISILGSKSCKLKIGPSFCLQIRAKNDFLCPLLPSWLCVKFSSCPFFKLFWNISLLCTQRQQNLTLSLTIKPDSEKENFLFDLKRTPIR